MESFLVQLGSIIKQARIEEGLTQAKLAEKAGISTLPTASWVKATICQC